MPSPRCSPSSYSGRFFFPKRTPSRGKRQRCPRAVPTWPAPAPPEAPPASPTKSAGPASSARRPMERPGAIVLERARALAPVDAPGLSERPSSSSRPRENDSPLVAPDSRRTARAWEIRSRTDIRVWAGGRGSAQWSLPRLRIRRFASKVKWDREQKPLLIAHGLRQRRRRSSGPCDPVTADAA
jgi:hypothetical protein